MIPFLKRTLPLTLLTSLLAVSAIAGSRVATSGVAMSGVATSGVAMSTVPMALPVSKDSQVAASLTVYSDNFAVVREVRRVILPEGLVELEYRDVAAHIDPTSVTVVSRGDASGFNVLEQSYRYDLLNRESLLARFINRKLKYARSVRFDNKFETIYREGNLLAINPEIVNFGDEIAIAPEGTITLGSVPPDLKTVPTLVWLVDNSRAGSRLLETTYISTNIKWQADYVLVLDRDKPMFDLATWVSLENQSGAQYSNASIKLVAGQINRVNDRRPDMERPLTASRMASQVPRQESFFDYHLYTLPLKTSIAHNETKQLRLMAASGASYLKSYVLESQLQNYQALESRNANVDIRMQFANTSSNQLGQPLPAGKVRVYLKDSDGELQLVGEDRITALAEGEVAHLSLGQAFDLRAEHKQLGFRRLGERVIEVTTEVTVRNRKPEAVTVTLHEKLFGDWEITQESLKGKKTDGVTQTYQLAVAGGSSATVVYTARIDY